MGMPKDTCAWTNRTGRRCLPIRHRSFLAPSVVAPTIRLRGNRFCALAYIKSRIVCVSVPGAKPPRPLSLAADTRAHQTPALCSLPHITNKESTPRSALRAAQGDTPHHRHIAARKLSGHATPQRPVRVVQSGTCGGDGSRPDGFFVLAAASRDEQATSATREETEGSYRAPPLRILAGDSLLQKPFRTTGPG